MTWTTPRSSFSARDGCVAGRAAYVREGKVFNHTTVCPSTCQILKQVRFRTDCNSHDVGESRETRYDLARNRARALLTLTRQKPPVDLDFIVERASVSVVERVLEEGIRATVGDVAGRRSIILNRNYQIRSAGERRWILAEELGHVLLGHRLVNSDAPGIRVVGLREWRRVLQEREARAFAAELLMPFSEVSHRWLGSLRERPERETAERVRRLASEFGVTPTAMRVRLEQMRILRQ